MVMSIKFCFLALARLANINTLMLHYIQYTTYGHFRESKAVNVSLSRMKAQLSPQQPGPCYIHACLRAVGARLIQRCQRGFRAEKECVLILVFLFNRPLLGNSSKIHL